MFKTAKLAVAALGLILASFTNASANLVVDGEFNNPLWPGAFAYYEAPNNFGASNVWHVASGSINLIGNYWQEPSPGTGTVDLNGESQGAISQLINTVTGHYRLTFLFTGNPELATYNGGIRNMRVSVGDATQDYSYHITTETRANMNYLTEVLDFNATGPTTLLFQSLVTSGPVGAVIGGISIEQLSSVPLPASVYMFAAALLTFAGYTQFRKNRVAA